MSRLVRSFVCSSWLLMAASGCDGPPVQTPDSRSIADAGSDAGPLEPLAIRCVSPEHGAMVEAGGTPLGAAIAVGDPDRIARVLVAGVEATPDALGVVTVDLPVRFGVNNVRVELEADDGRRESELCSFIV